MLTFITFILVLGLLIFVHELGHFIAARHVGVRVEVFSIGFPPTICGRKIGETEYKVSWIPLGGYVRLFGQNVHDEAPEDPKNYASKSLFQRLVATLAFIYVNGIKPLRIDILKQDLCHSFPNQGSESSI